MDKYTQLSRAVQTLACVCDGAIKRDCAGFNGGDTRFGHFMAELPLAQWTDYKAAKVYKMLRKYRNQLAGFGIDYDAIPEPKVTVFLEGSAGKMAMRDGLILVNLKYDPTKTVLAELKTIIPQGARKFNWELKMWEIQPTEETREVLGVWAAEHKFEVKPKLQQWLDEGE